MKTILNPVLNRMLTVKFFLVIFSCLLLAAACSKKLKAGDPLPLTYATVYMVGDATSIGWTITSALPMTKSAGTSNVFTWTGPLTAGEIKFPTALSWSADAFMAATANQPVSNNKAQLAPNANPDIHWKLASTDAGTYKITLNTQDLTVTFVKQ